MAGDTREQGPSVTLLSGGHSAFPEILQGCSDTAGLLPLLLPSQATSPGHCSFIFLESTVDVFSAGFARQQPLHNELSGAIYFASKGHTL